MLYIYSLPSSLNALNSVGIFSSCTYFHQASSHNAFILVRRIRKQVLVKETAVNSPLSLIALNFIRRLPLMRLYSIRWAPSPNTLNKLRMRRKKSTLFWLRKDKFQCVILANLKKLSAC
jgi:hypothetical protein